MSRCSHKFEDESGVEMFHVVLAGFQLRQYAATAKVSGEAKAEWIAGFEHRLQRASQADAR